MNKYTKRLKSLADASETNDFKPFYFDNKLVVSTANFVDTHDRILLVDGPALRLALAAALGSRSGLYASLAYSWNNLFRAFDGVAKNMGFQSMFNVDLTTAEMRNRQISQPGLFILQSPEKMELAYNDLRESVRQTYLAWKEVRNQNTSNPGPNQISTLVDPRVLQPFSRPINTSFSNVISLFDVNGSGGTIRSAVVAGEAVPVDLYKFFHGDTIPKDLKAFMPTSYMQGPKEFSGGSATRQDDLARVAGGPIRNYLQGTPNGWDIGLYSKYFPDVKSNDDVKKAARVLSQAWGGWLIGLPLSAMVL